MKTYHKYYGLLLFGTAILLSTACNKDFLDKKPVSSLVTPGSLTDCQQLLDNTTVFGHDPTLAEVSLTKYRFDPSFYLSILSFEQNAYIWATNIYDGGQIDDWDIPYNQIKYTNVVLETIQAMPKDSANSAFGKQLVGSASFLRAFAFYNLAQVFAPVYNAATSKADWGLLLKLTSDITVLCPRSSVEDTYQQILSDAKKAAALLPDTVPQSLRNRPSRPAALALLARVYLSMGKYAEAGAYADSSLQLYSTLIDYNTLDPQSTFPFSMTNAETLYQSRFMDYTELAGLFYPGCIVDSLLYQSYGPGDLRQQIFYTINYNGLPNLKGTYSGGGIPFSGLATDETYLIRAECAARAGDTKAALQDLNTLLKNRFATGTFVPLTAFSVTEAISHTLQEREKELAFRGLCWTDYRRLNNEGANISPSRSLQGQSYTLPAGSPRWTLPIPPDEMAKNPTIPQNPR